MISSVTSTIKSSNHEVTPQVKKAFGSVAAGAGSILSQLRSIPAKVREDLQEYRECRDERDKDDVN